MLCTLSAFLSGGCGVCHCGNFPLTNSTVLNLLHNAAMPAGQANGVNKVWLDGQPVFARNDITYQTDGSDIAKFILHVYHGAHQTCAREAMTQSRHLLRTAAYQ